MPGLPQSAVCKPEPLGPFGVNQAAIIGGSVGGAVGFLLIVLALIIYLSRLFISAALLNPCNILPVIN